MTITIVKISELEFDVNKTSSYFLVFLELSHVYLLLFHFLNLLPTFPTNNIFAWPMQLHGHNLENKPYATLPPVLSKISRPAAEKSVDQRLGCVVTGFFLLFYA